MSKADINVWIGQWHLSPGEDLEARIRKAITRSDIALLLLSPAAVGSKWVREEIDWILGEELARRGIDVVVALLAPCELPERLRGRQMVDLTGDEPTFKMGELIDRIRFSQMIDFSTLAPRMFEQLVADLLRELGFRIDVHEVRRDTGVDFLARYDTVDPFGAAETETWFVVIKGYRSVRVSVSSIRDLVALLQMRSRGARGLLVMAGHLTSLARASLNELQRRHGTPVRILEGPELKQLLLMRPGLARKHFELNEQDASGGPNS